MNAHTVSEIWGCGTVGSWLWMRNAHESFNPEIAMGFAVWSGRRTVVLKVQRVTMGASFR